MTLTGDLPQSGLAFFVVQTSQAGETLWIDDGSVERIPNPNVPLLALGIGLLLTGITVGTFIASSMRRRRLRPGERPAVQADETAAKS